MNLNPIKKRPVRLLVFIRARYCTHLYFIALMGVSNAFGMELLQVYRIDPPYETLAGGHITIEGKDFNTEGNQHLYVLFTDQNNLRVSQEVECDNEIIHAQIPEDMSPGKIKIVLMRRSSDGRVDETPPLSYAVQAPPRVKELYPQEGSMGTLVRISGSDLGPLQNDSYVVFVGETDDEPRASIRAMVEDWGENEIKVRVPEMVSGPAEVYVVKMNPDSNHGVLIGNGDKTRFMVVEGAK